MKQDILIPPVEGVSIAIAPDDPTLAAAATAEALVPWGAWLLNHNDYPLRTVLIVSEGYGEHDGRPVTTSKLRYFFEEVGPQQAVRVELIDPALFHLTNQFWVSYYHGPQLHDKKYVFVPGSLESANLTPIALLEGRAGVLHS